MLGDLAKVELAAIAWRAALNRKLFQVKFTLEDTPAPLVLEVSEGMDPEVLARKLRLLAQGVENQVRWAHEGRRQGDGRARGRRR